MDKLSLVYLVLRHCEWLGDWRSEEYAFCLYIYDLCALVMPCQYAMMCASSFPGGKGVAIDPRRI